MTWVHLNDALVVAVAALLVVAGLDVVRCGVVVSALIVAVAAVVVVAGLNVVCCGVDQKNSLPCKL